MIGSPCLVHGDGIDRAGALAAGAAGDAASCRSAGPCRAVFSSSSASLMSASFLRRMGVRMSLSPSRLRATSRSLSSSFSTSRLRGADRIVQAVAEDLPLVPLGGEDPADPGRRTLQADCPARRAADLVVPDLDRRICGRQTHRHGRVARPVDFPHHRQHRRQRRLDDLVAPFQLAPHADRPLPGSRCSMRSTRVNWL